MVWNNHNTGFSSMFKDLVASTLADKIPAIFLYQFDYFFDLQNKKFVLVVC